MSRRTRLVAAVRIALAQLRHQRLRTVLAVAGVALAVLASVLLASVGAGVLETGQQKFDQSGRDLWVTGGPIELRPGTVGGFKSRLVNAHDVADQIAQRDGVSTAVPMAFQTVYASQNTSDFQTIIAAGAPARGPSVSITAGRPFQQPDIHYADGNYTGPLTREAVLTSRAASLLGVAVNDTIHLGGTLATARAQEFRVVGISPTYAQFVGSPTATLHLSELQEITGMTASDRATFITVDVEEGANVTAVKRGLEAAYPEYTIRTNTEQLQALLADQALVIVSGASLVLLAVVAGILLVVNLQLSFLFRRQREFGALKAIGLSQWSLLGIVTAHVLSIGFLGALLGVGAAIPATSVVNAVVAAVSGFDGVVSVSPVFLAGGFLMALLVSVIGAIASALYLARMQVTSALESR